VQELGLTYFGLLTPLRRLVSASCSPGQRFAYSFPQIPPRWDTLAVRLTLPLAGFVEDFHLQVSAPCRAHQKKTGLFRGRVIVNFGTIG